MTSIAVRLERISAITFALLVCISSATSVLADTKTWTGAVDNLWSTAGNWAGGAPVAGDRLVFPVTASNYSNTNDFPSGTTFFDITFLGSGYTLSGNHGISDNVGSNVIAAPLALTATQTIAGNNLLLNGPVDLGSSRSPSPVRCTSTAQSAAAAASASSTATTR
jgi:hypothetical protein